MTQSPIRRLPLVMTTEEVAALLRCNPETVERYVFGHQLAAIRIGRERRFRADDVLDFVNSRRTPAESARRSSTQAARP